MNASYTFTLRSLKIKPVLCSILESGKELKDFVKYVLVKSYATNNHQRRIFFPGEIETTSKETAHFHNTFKITPDLLIIFPLTANQFRSLLLPFHIWSVLYNQTVCFEKSYLVVHQSVSDRGGLIKSYQPYTRMHILKHL